MNFFKDFQKSITGIAKAHRFIIKHKLWVYVIIPGIISISLFIITLLIGSYISENIKNQLFHYIGLSNNTNDFTGIIAFIVSFLIRVIVNILLFGLYFSVYKNCVMILISPLLTILSAKVEFILTRKKYNINLSFVIKDTAKAIVLVIRNFILEGLIYLFCLIICFIPVVDFFVPWFLLVVGFYFNGYYMFYYNCERKQMSIGAADKYMWKNRGSIIGSGFMYNLLLLIPFIGIMVAPAYSVIRQQLYIKKIFNFLISVKNLSYQYHLHNPISSALVFYQEVWHY